MDRFENTPWDQVWTYPQTDISHLLPELDSLPDNHEMIIARGSLGELVTSFFQQGFRLITAKELVQSSTVAMYSDNDELRYAFLGDSRVTSDVFLHSKYGSIKIAKSLPQNLGVPSEEKAPVGEFGDSYIPFTDEDYAALDAIELSPDQVQRHFTHSPAYSPGVPKILKNPVMLALMDNDEKLLADYFGGLQYQLGLETNHVWNARTPESTRGRNRAYFWGFGDYLSFLSDSAYLNSEETIVIGLRPKADIIDLAQFQPQKPIVTKYNRQPILLAA